MMMARLLKFGIAVVTLICANAASATCNNPMNWMESPSEGVRVIRGFKEDLGSFAEGQGDGLPKHAYPPPFPVDAKETPLNTDEDSPEDYWVSYYEIGIKNSWRICRVEKWLRRAASEPGLRNSIVNAMHQPGLSELVKSHLLLGVDSFLYDSMGRIAQKVHVVEANGKAKLYIPDCFWYGEGDYITLWVRASDTDKCPRGEPDNRDDWNRYKYVLVGGAASYLWEENHLGRANGTWSKHIVFRDRPGPDPTAGQASADSERGLYKILGGNKIGLLDKSIGPTITYSDGGEKPIEYQFPDGNVPLSILDDVEHRMYDYARRRETQATSGVKLLEYFPPRQHEIGERFYTGPDGRTLRQEILYPNGKLKRVINLALVGIGKDKGGFYEEDLGHGQIGILLKAHELLYRVWDYDVAGKAKLVAVGWNKRFGSAFVGSETLDRADVAYGTPDWKEKWKSKEEFFKAFDFDEYASRAYPRSSPSIRRSAVARATSRARRRRRSA